MTKEPYKVPTLAEIYGKPTNGLTVASTFSGGGGSSTGYRMAGFKVVWANEFVPAAQQTYRANHPETILDGRDIRIVKASEILEATGLEVGELDLFDGSPPCQLFSTSGKREKGWNKSVDHADGAAQKSSDDLFFEYARLVRELQPKTFIGENVSGLVKGTAKGYFKLILKALQECGYTVEARLVDASWLGVPQRRQRLIFQGVRNDLNKKPAWPAPFPYRYSVEEALVGVRTASTDHKADLTGSALGKLLMTLKPGQSHKERFNLVRSHPKEPAPTITASSGQMAGPCHPVGCRRFTIPELRRLSSFPDDYVLTGSYAEQWARLGNSVPPLMIKALADTIRDEVLDNPNADSGIVSEAKSNPGSES